jgi:hypothetical protein
MKRQLKFLKIRALSSIFLGLLLVTYSCQTEDTEIIEEQVELQDENVNNDVTDKKASFKTFSGSCDNPSRRNNGQTQYARRYTVGEINGLSDSNDLVSKYATSSTSNNPKSVNEIRFLDDRTCSFNYAQSGSYGLYRLAANSNRFDGLQPRIERQSKKVDRGANRFTSVEGYVNIRSVGSGDAVRNTASATIANQKDFNEDSGTYIMQAKGRHSNQTEGSPDPAILLILAKPANSTRSGGARYNLYAEQITRPGGSGPQGRELVFLKTISGNQDVFIKMVNRFSSTGLTQSVDIQIGKNPTLKNYTFRVPNDRGRKRGSDGKIRFGAYRCKNGSADIRWKDIKHNYRS